MFKLSFFPFRVNLPSARDPLNLTDNIFQSNAFLPPTHSVLPPLKCPPPPLCPPPQVSLPFPFKN